MARLDWSRDRDRRRLREQSADPLNGDIILPGRPKQRPGKSVLRAELAAATQKITLGAQGPALLGLREGCGMTG